MEKASVILIVIGIISTVASAWSLILSIRHSKMGWQKAYFLSDVKYNELKSKIDFVIAAAVILIGVIGIIGYQQIESIRNDLLQEFKGQRDSIILLRREAEEMLNAAKGADSLVKKSLHNADVLAKKIDLIAEKDILKGNTFLIHNVRFGDFPNSLKDQIVTIDFKKLTTIDGKKLPAFKKPPLLFIQSSHGAVASIRELTINRVIISIGMYESLTSSEDELSKIRFNLWMTDVP
jgi:hypothetical protein